MLCKHSASALALVAAGALTMPGAQAQVANTTPSNVNILNLLAPYLNLNATSVGQNTLALNLSQAIATNNGANLATQAKAISDKTIFGGTSTSITLADGTRRSYGVAANLAGGVPAQAMTRGSVVTPIQPIGGLGAVLGPIYQAGVANNGALLPRTTALLVSAYNFTSADLGVAKNYFANGAATNPSVTPPGYQPVPAVAPAGYTLPRANGLPNTTNSVYDIAYGVKNNQAGQDVYGSSRPVQVAPTKFNQFDPSALDGLATNPSFPSGHTTYGYTDSILLAMLVPQTYQSMILRGSDYGNSRIVLDVHYPLDIIASRALASYDLAQAFTNPLYINNATTTGTPVNLPALFTAAAPEIQTYLAANCGASVATCANSAANQANNPYVPSAANQALYQQRLTYGLPTLTYAQAPREAAPTGGPDASILLAPLFGGSTAAAKTIEPNGGIYANLSTTTINQIIVNTEYTALAAFYGSPLSYWTRIDLYSAAGYFNGVTGTLSLTPTDVVSTNVTIADGGTLAANGRITGATIVASGGTLAGSGNVAAVAVQAGGTLAPGSLAAQTALRSGATNVTGTRLTANGALGFAPGSTYKIYATPSQATSAAVTGAATVSGAKVRVLAANGRYSLADRSVILTAAGGVAGRFASTSTNLPFLAARLAYTANDVTLSFAPNRGAIIAAGSTLNERAVASGIVNAADTGGNSRNAVLNAIVNLSNGPQARAAFNGLSGEGITAAQNSAFRSAQLFNSAIFDQTTFYGSANAANSITLADRLPGFVGLAPSETAPIRELADLPSKVYQPVASFVPQRTWRAWATGFGGVEDIQASAATGAASQNNSIYGGALGVDYQLTPNYLVGVAVGGSDGDFRVDNRATSGSSTGGHVAIYDIANFGPYYGASSSSFSYFNNRSTRFVSGIGNLGTETERGSFDSHEYRTRVEFGRHFGELGGVVTPFIALEIAELRSNGFTETAAQGAGNFRLNVSGQSTASVPAFVGARLQQVMAIGNGMVLTPTLQAAYVHEFAPYRSQIGTIADLPGSTFLVDGARPGRNAAQVKAGGDLSIGPSSAIFANFDGEFSGVNQVYAGKGGFRYTW